MKEFLSRAQVEFETIDIGDLDDPMGTLREITGGQVATPTLIVGDEILVGYDEAWLKERFGDGSSSGRPLDAPDR